MVYNLTYHDGLFSYIQEISAYFSSLGNVEFLMFRLKHSVKTGAIMSEFHLRILTGISPFGVDVLVLMLLISFFTSSTYLNEKYVTEKFIKSISNFRFFNQNVPIFQKSYSRVCRITFL